MASTFGIWADGGMRTVKHDSSVNWIGIRAMSGIADGEEYEWKVTIGGTDGTQGIAIGNASADLSSYVGNNTNGFVYFGHVGELYHNGSSIATLSTFAAGDVIHVSVSRVTDQAWFRKQTGGTGSFTTYGPYDISALGAGTWYPIHALYNTNGQATYDFGQSEFTSQSGFDRGPIGPWGPWNITTGTVIGTYSHDDTTRMWRTSTAVGTLSPDVTAAGDPVGGWHDWEYRQAITQSTAANRLEYQTTGIVCNSTSVFKQLRGPFSRNYDAACWHGYKSKTVTGTQVKSGFFDNATPTVQRTGFTNSATNVQTVNIRTAVTASTVSAVGSDISGVFVFDGTSAFMICDDGSKVVCAVGTGTINTDNINFRGEIPSSGTREEIRQIMVYGTGALSETEAKNLQYWMDTAFP